MRSRFTIIIALLMIVLMSFGESDAQSIERRIEITKGTLIDVTNRYGRVFVETSHDTGPAGSTNVKISASSKASIGEKVLDAALKGSAYIITVTPARKNDRIDLQLTVPERSRLKIETRDGEIRVAGDIENVSAITDTGTINADIPTDDVRYEMIWSESRPRFLSDFELENVKERSAGRFEIKGIFRGQPKDLKSGNPASADIAGEKFRDQAGSDAGPIDHSVTLKFTTARGIVIINVPPNEVMNDLRERPLTNAAKAIIRSGDTMLMDAIRRASPKYFGEYSRTLPPLRREPAMVEARSGSDRRSSTTVSVTARVTDLQNRAVTGLETSDFEATESGESREIVSVRPTTAPVNLVLLLDVSGSVENYVNFIRKAARAFVDTVDRRDRISIVLFNEDVQTLEGFTTDHTALSKSLDTFDAGGGTAYYDAIGYTLTETLRPLRGERTAIVILTDGDDNRSFLPFDSLAGSIEESGALIYPLYVPSSLIAAAASDPTTAVDPLRSRYLSNDLTSKADADGKNLARISGGVYYPITQLSQIQTAYEDIVSQLRTAYDIVLRTTYAPGNSRTSPRLKFRTKRPNLFVQVTSISEVGSN